MRKVFVVIDHAVYDYEDYGVGTQVFATYDKAREEFNNLVAQVKEAEECEGWIFDEYEDRFRAYEEGDYTKNHAYCQIREQEIR